MNNQDTRNNTRSVVIQPLSIKRNTLLKHKTSRLNSNKEEKRIQNLLLKKGVQVGQSDSTAGRVLALHVADPGQFPSILRVPQVPPEIISECRVWVTLSIIRCGPKTKPKKGVQEKNMMLLNCPR